jgi:methionyl-tRNA formyltransferase
MQNKKQLRIIFMGTPDFSVPSLEAILENNYEVAAVVTTPDRLSGRGLKKNPSAVKRCALKHGLPVLQPEKLKNPEFLAELKSFDANLFIVIAFRMLPEAVWQMPEKGTFNLHASLLPHYRGAAPINHAIINGEKVTGLTTFFLRHEIDTGDIILQEEVAIEESDNAGSLHDKLMVKGAGLLIKTLKMIEEDQLKTIPQKDLKSNKKAPKIFKNDCEINWEKPAVQIRNFIRGLSPYPAAWTTFNGKLLKVFDLSIAKDMPLNEKPGTFIPRQTQLFVCCSDAVLEINELQIQGKKRMKTADFMRGFKLK